MANYTTNIRLQKPLDTDYYSIDVFNDNADIIDAQIKQVKDSINQISSNVGNIELKAEKVTVADSTNVFTATNVEGVLLENRNKINTNTSNISKNTKSMSEHATLLAQHVDTLSEHTTTIATNKTNISNLTTRVTSAESNISSNTTKINQHTNTLETHANQINALSEELGANVDDLYESYITIWRIL